MLNSVNNDKQNKSNKDSIKVIEKIDVTDNYIIISEFHGVILEKRINDVLKNSK